MEASSNSPGFFSAADAQRLPFKNKTFDYVILSEVIEHIPDDRMALMEISRVLKKDGLLVLTTESDEGIFPPTDICHKGGTKHYVNYRQSYDRKKLRKLASEAGFEVLETNYTLSLIGKIFMEAIKYVFIKKEPDFSRQSDIKKVQKTFTFTFYRKMFPFILILSKTDILFSKFLKGACIMARLKKSVVS